MDGWGGTVWERGEGEYGRLTVWKVKEFTCLKHESNSCHAVITNYLLATLRTFNIKKGERERERSRIYQLVYIMIILDVNGLLCLPSNQLSYCLSVVTKHN